MQPGDVYQPPPGSARRDNPYTNPGHYPPQPPVPYPPGASPFQSPGRPIPHSASSHSMTANPFSHPADARWNGGGGGTPPPVPRPPAMNSQMRPASPGMAPPQLPGAYGDPMERTGSNMSYNTPYGLPDNQLTSPPPLHQSHSAASLGYPTQPTPYHPLEDDYNDDAPLLHHGHARPDPRFNIAPPPAPYALSDNGPVPGSTGDMGIRFDDPYGDGPRETANLHYGPLPARIVRRNRTQKRVHLFRGHLVLDVPVPTMLLDQCPIKEGNEFTKMRYTAVTCDPDDFVADKFTLRQRLYDPPRHTELFIVVTMYNEEDDLFCRTMRGIMQNIAHFCNRPRSKFWGKDGWKKIVVCIVSDGRLKINDRTRSVLAALGVYQEGVGKNVVNGKPVTAHLYEYTTQLSISSSLKIGPGDKNSVPVQLLFCLKEKNQKKINSHRWFFNAFGKCLNPNICVLLDVGTAPAKTSIYHLWKAFDINSSVGGACGEIIALKGKYGMSLIKNPLVAAQNFEYKMSNILDKPLESIFGYITVLPGAFSAYRYIALQNDETGQGPLEKYFYGETMHGAGAGIFKANMYLAEDRILCWELVSKRSSMWTLHYVKSASAETDVPDGVPELVSQRRRWLNGSFFAAIHSIVHFGYLYRSSHSFWRKFFLHIELLYQVINNVFAWFALGNYYIAFRVLTQSMETLGKGWKYVSIPLNYAYLALLLVCFILALGNRPAGSKWGYTIAMIGFALITIYMLFCAVYLAVIGITELDKSGAITKESIFKSKIFTNIVVSLLATYGLYIVSSLLALDPWHLLTSFVQYLLIAPSYINVLNVYAFSNVHDVSWGTKGSDKVSEDLGVVKSTSDNKDEVEVFVPVEQKDINAVYEAELQILASPAPKEEKKVNAEQKQEDYYKNFRSNVLLSWTLSNAALAVGILQTSVTKTNADGSQDIAGVAAIYMGVMLYTVAGLALFRFLGAATYMLVRLFQGE